MSPCAPNLRPPPARAGKLKTALLLALCATASGGVALAPSTSRADAPAADPKLPFTRLQLSNGLDLLVHEDHTVPVVGVSVWYHVGSKDEVRGRTGFAHLFEHMMFQGSQHVGDDMHFKYISSAGGFLNGTTNEDRTNYFEVVPSNFLERVLYLEADRMGFLLPSLTKEKLDNQRDVVRNERRQSYEMPPYGMVPKYLAEALYPPEHPYHHLTIGDHADLAAATVEDVKSFFNKWYAPSNAVIVVAGDVSAREARRLVDKWFGGLPKRPKPTPVKDLPVPSMPRERTVEITDTVTLPRLYLAWHSPAIYKPGDADLDMLAGVLGGKSGRLYKRLVYKDRLAQDVRVEQGSQYLSSIFLITVTAKEGGDLSRVRQIVDEELARLRKEPPTAKEMERVKNEHEASFVYDLQSVGGFSGRTEVLQTYYAFTGDPDYLSKDIARFRATTAESVRQAQLTWLSPGRVTLMVRPGPKSGLGDGVVPTGAGPSKGGK